MISVSWFFVLMWPGLIYFVSIRKCFQFLKVELCKIKKNQQTRIVYVSNICLNSRACALIFFNFHIDNNLSKVRSKDKKIKCKKKVFHQKRIFFSDHSICNNNDNNYSYLFISVSIFFSLRKSIDWGKIVEYLHMKFLIVFLYRFRLQLNRQTQTMVLFNRN